YRGNVYLKNVIGEDGRAQTIQPDQLVFDTLPNGKVLLKRLPGELDQVAIDEEDTFLRQNFYESDNRNFRDGDIESSREFLSGKRDESDPNAPSETSSMYKAPTQARVTYNDEGVAERKFDKSKTKTTLITDETRVYKGGSWKDRAYWLDPAQRRFLPQYIATDYIGFRCAMTRLGSKSKVKKSARHKRQG
ncbi:MAG: gliding motility lipoprotein GldJ, partial [Flavobacteriaceae bacterium]